MSATRQDEDLGYAAVVEAVSQWPVSQRLHLMQHLLNTLDVDLNQHPNGAMRASEVEGLLAGPGAAPSDEDVRRLVADYLEEKYR